MIKIKIGEFDVIDSGRIVNSNNQKIRIVLGDSIHFTTEFEFEFNNDGTKSTFEAYNIEEVGVGIRFKNFGTINGSGHLDPIKIGYFNGRSLHINYRVFQINFGKGVIFDYTFLLGNKVDTNGNEIG